MITITKIKQEDLPALKELYDKGFQNTITDFEKMQKVFAFVEKNSDYTLLCAKEEDEMIGSMLGVVNRGIIGECRPFMVIEDVVVSSSHRRKKVATRLMEQMEEIAKENNCIVMMLMSRMKRKGAHQFYESLGFRGDLAIGFKKYLR